MNLIDLLILTLGATETSTATWVVLMVVVGFLNAGVLAAWRIYAGKVGKAEDDLRKAEDKVSDTRHNELKTMIGGIDSSVRSMTTRVDGVEKRVGTLERGHAVMQARMGLNAHGEDPE